jgi:NADPH:quinone reductase-like Zn-dependent oxidoreductase
MKAAVIRSFDAAPKYEDFAAPEPRGREEARVSVLAAGLHRLTRGRATGSHYSTAVEPPLVPGVDGVGRDERGKLRYFVLGETRFGSMAERTVIELDHSIVLPRGCDPVTVAAAMNPAMGAWLALRCRYPFKRRQKVLILGATGNSGSLGVQIARHLGASQIIAAGRDEQRLARTRELGATDAVPISDPKLGWIAREVDVVLDFVWGESTGPIMHQLVSQRPDRSRRLTWIEIGSTAGETAPVPSAPLRAANFQIIGSGFGSVSGREIVKELPALVKELAKGTFRIDAKAVPLRDVESAWGDASSTAERIVLTP